MTNLFQLFDTYVNRFTLSGAVFFAGTTFIAASGDVVHAAHDLPVHTVPEQARLVVDEPVPVLALSFEHERIKQLSCLSMAIYAEARSESKLGRRMVGETILNRVDSSSFPSTICEVVYQPSQFSFVDDVNAVKADMAFQSYPPSREVLEAIQIAKDAIARPAKERTAGDHYHAVYVKPKWSAELREVATIEQHVFYSRH